MAISRAMSLRHRYNIRMSARILLNKCPIQIKAPLDALSVLAQNLLGTTRPSSRLLFPLTATFTSFVSLSCRNYEIIWESSIGTFPTNLFSLYIHTGRLSICNDSER